MFYYFYLYSVAVPNSGRRPKYGQYRPQSFAYYSCLSCRRRAIVYLQPCGRDAVSREGYRNSAARAVDGPATWRRHRALARRASQLRSQVAREFPMRSKIISCNVIVHYTVRYNTTNPDCVFKFWQLLISKLYESIHVFFSFLSKALNINTPQLKMLRLGS